MTKKIWRGDAPEVAQVTRITPVNVQVGNQFSILINGKPITVTAVTASAAAVCTLLAAAIAASPSPEFAEFDATVDGGSLVLTAATAGVPFVVTAGAGNGTVVIDRIQAGYAGANAVQVVAVPVTLQGTWTVTWNDQTTSALASGASAAAVQTALQALSRIGSGNCTVTRATSADSNDYLYTLTFVSGLAARPIAPVVVDLIMTGPFVRRLQLGSATGMIRNEIQSITFPDGSAGFSTVYFTVTKDGSTVGPVAISIPPENFRGSLNSLTTVEGVIVSRSGDMFIVEFSVREGNATQSLMSCGTWVDGGGAPFTIFGGGDRRLVFPTVTEVGVTTQSETQTVTLVGAPTGGTYTLTYGANTTAGIAHNATAGTIQTALQGLASVGAGNMLVTGAAGGPYTVTAAGSLAGSPLTLISAASSLTGGVTDSVTVVTTTASGGPNHYDDSRNWSPAGVPVDGDDVVFAGGGADCLYGLDQSSVLLDSLTIEMSWQNRKLGLPEYSSSRYLEYRPPRLKIGAIEINIGTGVGTGPSRVYLDTGTDETLLKVWNSGSSSDTLPAVVWVGLHADNAIEVYGGEFGTSPSENSTFRSLKQTGGRVVLHNSNVSDEISAKGNSFRSYNTFHGGALLEI